MNPGPNTRNGIPRIYLLFSVIAFLFLCWYACARVWDYDEGWSYASVKTESLLDLLLYRHFNIANNHLLNSLWFRLMQVAGAGHVFFFRGLSLLSFFPFAYYLYKAATYKTDVQPGAWFALFFLPPVLVYFASGRGYALAIAALCGALYYLQLAIDTKRSTAWWKFIVCGVASSLAIVSFFYPFAAMLIYFYARTGLRSLFTTRSILSGILLLALTAYIYYIGKTILLHDKIINGTENLVFNGMYSTFFGTFSLYDLTPWPQAYARLHLDFVTKVIVMASFVPVGVILLWKYLGRYRGLVLVLITTALFLAARIALHAKYPSDRSVLYLLYLIYIPVVLVIAGTRNKLFIVHYAIIFFFCTLNLAGFIYETNRPNVYSTLAAMPDRPYTVYSDYQNWADVPTSELRFHGRITFHYIARSFETDLARVDQEVKAAINNPHVDFILLQETGYQRNSSLFTHDFIIRPVLSSGFKQLYLISKAQ
jgi:hypothetical protein